MNIGDQIRLAKQEAEALAAESGVQTTSSTVRAELERVAKIEGLPGDARGMLEAILKLGSFEDTTSISVTVTNDPLKQTQTLEERDPAAPAVVQGDSALAENISQLNKRRDEITKQVDAQVAELSKLVETGEAELAKQTRVVLAKAGPATEKLAEVQQLFGITINPGDDDDWKIRCKVGDLISTLLQFSAVERMIGASPAAPAVGKAAAPAKKSDAVAWPSDMARAKFDEKSGSFQSGDPSWGRDAHAR